MEPVAQMVGLAPGQGPGAAGEHTAAIADGQGDPVGGGDDPVGGGDDPGGAADLQRLGGGTAQGRG
jgi:hypothetical protein